MLLTRFVSFPLQNTSLGTCRNCAKQKQTKNRSSLTFFKKKKCVLSIFFVRRFSSHRHPTSMISDTNYSQLALVGWIFLSIQVFLNHFAFFQMDQFIYWHSCVGQQSTWQHHSALAITVRISNYIKKRRQKQQTNANTQMMIETALGVRPLTPN